MSLVNTVEVTVPKSYQSSTHLSGEYYLIEFLVMSMYSNPTVVALVEHPKTGQFHSFPISWVKRKKSTGGSVVSSILEEIEREGL